MNLTYKEELSYYDGVLEFTAVDEDKNLYFVAMFDYTQNPSIYVAVHVTETEISQYKRLDDYHLIKYKELLHTQPWYLVYVTNNGIIATRQQGSIENSGYCPYVKDDD